MGRNIVTEIDIRAPVDRVWEVLTDFPAYPEWNPFITRVDGAPIPHTEMDVTIHPPGRDPITFRPLILHADPEEGLAWLGRLWMPGLFAGLHAFNLEPLDNGRVRLVHSEHFAGFLVPFLWPTLSVYTTQGFEAMNRALKARAEAPH